MLLAATKSHSSPLMWIILILAYGAFWYFFMRPRAKKAKEARQQGKFVNVGDKVQTIGGIVGTVTSMSDDVVTVTSGNSTLDLHRSAIARRLEVAPNSAATTETPNEGAKE